MTNAKNTIDNTLRYTESLWGPFNFEFMIYTFVLGLILIGLIYLLPLFLRKYFPGIVKYSLIHDFIFICLYSSIYLYWLSDGGKGLGNITYRLFYGYAVVLILVLIISVSIRRKYFTFNYSGIVISYGIGFGLLFVCNTLFELIDAIT